MTSERIDAFRGDTYEIAEAIAPTWERRRAEIEEVSTPVRERMLHVLQPREGDTVLELGAGVGDTGFDAGAIVGERGHLISTDSRRRCFRQHAAATPNAAPATSSIA